MTTGKFKDPQNPAFRLYGEVLSAHDGELFVKVTRRNSRKITPFNTIVRYSEFVTDSGANKGYWRRQLRGKDGRFIEMGGGISWTDSNGNRKLGTVEGFDDEIERVIVRDSDGNEYKLSADEIKQSTVKAVIPDSDSDSDSDAEELDFDALITELEGERVDIEEFMGDESKFPVGGPPLEIKDKQGNILGKVHKEKNPDAPGGFNLVYIILSALLSRHMADMLSGKKK